MEKIFTILENINKLLEQDTVQDELKLKDSYNIIEFVENAPSTTAGGMKIAFISAVVDVPYEGRQGIIPINNTITDWVKRNELKIANALWDKIREYVNKTFPAWAGQGLVEKYRETHDSPINQDQTEFYPEFQEGNVLRIMLDAEIILEK